MNRLSYKVRRKSISYILNAFHISLNQFIIFGKHTQYSIAKRKIGYDDALDAFGCHSVGGVVGGLLTGIFCVPELSWTDFGGLLYTGDPSLLLSQFLGILVTLAVVIVLGLVIGLVVKAIYTGSLRVTEADEARGLDVAAHGESAYPAYLGLD